MSRVFFGCSGSIHWQHMPTRTLRNEVLPRDLPTPGICVGTLPTRRFREVFFLRCFAIVLLYFEADLRCLGSRFVFLSRGERDWRASRCRRASNEGIEAPDDVDRWCSWTIGDSLGGAPLGGADSIPWFSILDHDCRSFSTWTVGTMGSEGSPHQKCVDMSTSLTIDHLKIQWFTINTLH